MVRDTHTLLAFTAVPQTLPTNILHPLDVDMNGLIHPCCHPEDGAAPPTEEEMYLKIMEYVDRLVSVVRPRKVLFLAIDGVAPRAKMNQQRSRRFRSALEAQDAEEDKERLRQQFQKWGRGAPDEGPEPWDSNVITPGTPFMDKLSAFIVHAIAYRVNTDPLWQKLTVVYSDAFSPGEGEHKIMAFIRQQRAQPGYEKRHPLRTLYTPFTHSLYTLYTRAFTIHVNRPVKITLIFSVATLTFTLRSNDMLDRPADTVAP